MLNQMFDDTFEHLGTKAMYGQEGFGFVECLVLIKEPEQMYELGDGQFVERIATFEIMSRDVNNPKIGDYLYVNGNKYKLYQAPLLDPSGTVYEITAIFVGAERVELNISIAGDLDRVIEAFGATEQKVRTASMRAINKTALWVQAKSAKEISAQKKIQLKLIRQKLKIIKANRNVLKAFVVANLYGIKASKLGQGAPGGIRQNASGASVGGHQFPGAFVAKMPKHGHVGIFKRKTTKRLPIQEQYLQLNPEASEIINNNVENEASQVFAVYFDHELNYVTRSAS